MRIYLRFEIRRIFCRRCGAVKRERLDFLADNPFYTKRFADHVGRRCRGSAIKEIAVRSCCWTGTQSRSWTSSTCRRNGPRRHTGTEGDRHR